MKLLIAVPSLDFMHVDFVKSLTGLILRLKDEGEDFDLLIESGTLVHMARDKIACRAINEGYTHVLWLDADMVFTPDLLEDLRFSGKDFVTGICHSRRPPFGGCLFENLDLKHLKRLNGPYPASPFRVAGCGFACVLIRTEILKAVQEHYRTCFTPMVGYGEDTAFCLRAGELGYEIWAEPTVRPGHIGHIAIYPEEYERWMAQLQTK